MPLTYISPSAPAICASSGVRVLFAIVSASAPGYEAVTTTVGGVRFGNCDIGRLLIAVNPKIIIIMAITAERTGLFIKNLLYI